MQIVINGRTELGKGELPPNLREQCDQMLAGMQDQIGKGVQGILEQGIQEQRGTLPMQIATSQRIMINGRQYESVEQMPPEDRRLFEQMQGLIGTQLAAAPVAKPQPAGPQWRDPLEASNTLLPPSNQSGFSVLWGAALVLLGFVIGVVVAVVAGRAL